MLTSLYAVQVARKQRGEEYSMALDKGMAATLIASR